MVFWGGGGGGGGGQKYTFQKEIKYVPFVTEPFFEDRAWFSSEKGAGNRAFLEFSLRRTQADNNQFS